MSRLRGSLLALLALAAGSVPAGAQEAAQVRLSGVVEDSITGRALPGATVTLTAAHRVVFTDSLGRFSIDLHRTVTDRVRVTQIGFATASFDAVIRPGTRLRIRLTPDPVTLKEITARAQRNNSHAIEGTVLDSVTGRPVPHAVVWFRSSGGHAVTDTFGHYVFERAQGGPEDVVVDVLGYKRRVAYRRITEPWQRLDLALEPDPIVLQGILVLNERMKHVGALALKVFAHDFSERAFAESGRSTPFDFLQWAQAFSSPHKGSGPSAKIPCVPEIPKFRIMVDSGGNESALVVNGRMVMGGENGKLEVDPSDFYRAIFMRDIKCGGMPYVVVYTKSRLREAIHAGHRPVVIPRDSIESLVAHVDSLR